MQLTPKQLKEFDELGYLVLPNCFSEEEIEVLRSEAEAIYATDREEVWREKSGAPRTAFAAHTYNEAFGLLGRHPRLIKPLEQFFGEPVYMHQFKINAKAPFDGELWQWHQDYGTWKRDDGMPEARAMNISVFLDEVMAVNGPLMFIPKSHKGGTLAAGHDKTTTSYPLWTLDNPTVTKLVDGRRYHRADRQARHGADVPRQPGARLAAQHDALSAQDRLPDAVRGLQPHHAVQAGGVHCASRLHADRGVRRRCAAGLRAQVSAGCGVAWLGCRTLGVRIPSASPRRACGWLQAPATVRCWVVRQAARTAAHAETGRTLTRLFFVLLATGGQAGSCASRELRHRQPRHLHVCAGWSACLYCLHPPRGGR